GRRPRKPSVEPLPLQACCPCPRVPPPRRPPPARHWTRETVVPPAAGRQRAEPVDRPGSAAGRDRRPRAPRRAARPRRAAGRRRVPAAVPGRVRVHGRERGPAARRRVPPGRRVAADAPRGAARDAVRLVPRPAHDPAVRCVRRRVDAAVRGLGVVQPVRAARRPRRRRLRAASAAAVPAAARRRGPGAARPRLTRAFSPRPRNLPGLRRPCGRPEGDHGSDRIPEQSRKGGAVPRIDGCDVYRVVMPRGRRPESVLVRLSGGDAVGWGEMPVPASPGDLSRAWADIEERMGPALVGLELDRPEDVSAAADFGAREAAAAIDTACWDLWCRARGMPLAHALGGTRTSIVTGSRIPPVPEPETVAARVNRAVGAGHTRVTVDIRPGWDIEPVRAIREAYPALAVIADAGHPYTESPEHRAVLEGLDAYGLAAIERPFAEGDLAAHARL